MHGDQQPPSPDAGPAEASTVFSGSGAPISVYTADVVATIEPEATLRELSVRLADGEVGALVVGTPEALLGLVSERDVVRALARGLDPDNATVREIASRDLLWCSPDATVGEVSDLMMEHYVRHVLVGEPGAMVGILSARDLLGAYAPPVD